MKNEKLFDEIAQEENLTLHEKLLARIFLELEVKNNDRPTTNNPTSY